MKLVFAGTPDVALPALETLISSEHDVLAVITQPPARAGRGRELQPSPVHAVADKYGIKALYPDSIREIDAVLRELQPDAIPVVAYGQLIPETMLDIPAHGWINLHFSLLPEWRGAAPVQHCIWHGDTITGATTFRIDQGMDSGPILGHVTQLVDPKDTSGALLDRLADTGSHLLRQTLDALEAGMITPIAQQHDQATYAPKLQKSDSRIDWQLPAIEIDRRIRAMTPKPGAWTTMALSEHEISLSIGPVSTNRDIQLDPGVICVIDKNVFVGSATYALELDRIKPPGKKFMLATDWMRGLRTEEVKFF
ncbi:MAG: methionyl-tRNA formyltransferase [Candidatus Nanopelagicales bacterium]|nr:methionyl-tRNA formyltransferase [Candidatus Nanopelagicales bacterium]